VLIAHIVPILQSRAIAAICTSAENQSSCFKAHYHPSLIVLFYGHWTYPTQFCYGKVSGHALLMISGGWMTYTIRAVAALFTIYGHPNQILSQFELGLKRREGE